VPLVTTQAGHGFADLAPLCKTIGDARVVALGEATHGTREFFQMKHRALEYLVDQMGFTVFAIEANWPESLAVNEYVLYGTGDAARVLAGMYFWTWNTEEVLDLIHWMRAWNADPRHDKKVRFYGFDMQVASVAATTVREYLERIDATCAKKFETLLASFEKNDITRVTNNCQIYSEAEDTTSRLLALSARFDEHREAWGDKSSAREWAVVRQHVRILQQAHEFYAASGSFAVRDRAMAENVRWILDSEAPGTRMVLWAHNGHVQRVALPDGPTLGTHLANQLGDAYHAVGFLFGHGAFQAGTIGASQWSVVEHHVGRPPSSTIEAAFGRLGQPMFFLDLRGLRAPTGRGMAAWLATATATREIGAAFKDESMMLRFRGPTLPSRFDSVIYIDETTRARPAA
jgi:erythromycin esterase